MVRGDNLLNWNATDPTGSQASGRPCSSANLADGYWSFDTSLANPLQRTATAKWNALACAHSQLERQLTWGHRRLTRLLERTGPVVVIGTSRPRTVFFDLVSLVSNTTAFKAHEDLHAGRWHFLWNPCEADFAGAMPYAPPPLGVLRESALAMKLRLGQGLDAADACPAAATSARARGYIFVTIGCCEAVRSVGPDGLEKAVRYARSMLLWLSARCAPSGAEVVLLPEMAVHKHCRLEALTAFNANRISRFNERLAVEAQRIPGIHFLDIYATSLSFEPSPDHTPVGDGTHYYSPDPARPFTGNAASILMARTLLLYIEESLQS